MDNLEEDSVLYSNAFENFIKKGNYKFGPLSSEKMRNDPQYILFQMSRYKHAAKLLSNKLNVIDIGTGDGIGLPILCSYFSSVTALDIDPKMLKYAKDYLDESYSCKFILHDFAENILENKFDAAFCFDVLSSIQPINENKWFENLCKSLTDAGILALGSQNKNITIFGNKKNHLDQPNFKTYEEINFLMNKFFKNVITLSMNDETIHTGYRKSAQYFLSFGISPNR